MNHSTRDILSKWGLVVKPPVIEFMDIYPGEDSSKKKVTFHNRGKHKINLKILKPYSWVFQIDEETAPIFLSPGLSHSITINYKFAHDCVSGSNLPFIIDNQYYGDVPIRVKKGRSFLVASPLHLNFGIIDLGCRFVAQYLTLTNSGSCSAKFAIDFGSNKLDLLATPKHGFIAPYGVQIVKLEMAGFSAGHMFDEFWVKGEPPSRIEVEVHVLYPYLQAIHPNTTGDFTLINYQPTFFGTERYETFIVQNVSSFSSYFVILAELNGQLVTLDKAAERLYVYSNFSLSPLEGTLGPFEGRIFTIKFHPHYASPKEKGWKHLKVDELEFLCFLRVLRVDVVEWQDDKENPFQNGLGRTVLAADTTLSGTNAPTDMLRLCLHGDGVKPMLTVVPDALCFDQVEIGKDYTKVLRLTNEATSLPVGYRYKKSPGFHLKPEIQFILPKKSLEVTVLFRVTSLASHLKNLTIEVVSYHDFTDQKKLETIDKVIIGLSISTKATTIKPKPKFISGITPFIAHETGVLTETIKYKDLDKRKPNMLLMPKKDLQKRPWLIGNSLVAFPNDMPHSLRVKQTDPYVRSIFTGIKRYVPPVDQDYTYTEEERKAIDKRNNELRKFYQDKAHKIRKALLLEENIPFVTRSHSRERLHKLLKPKDIFHLTHEDLFTKKKISKPAQLSEICPLTPTHLFNIRVMPKTLDFGKIPPNENCVKIIRIDNFNDFPVTIKLLVHKANISEPGFIIGPRSRKEKEITLNLKSYGKYYSNVAYVINNSHSFYLKLSADVVQRTLSISPTELTLNSSKSQFEDIFQVKWGIIKIFNPLYVPTKYNWLVPSGISFTVEPMRGEVPGNRSIPCVVYFDIRKKSMFGTTFQLVVHDDQQIPVRVTWVEDKSNNVAVLLTKRLFPPLPLNLLFIETILYFNAGFKDVVYSVVSPNPLEGFSVKPIAGIIPARSCIGLPMEISLTSINVFDFTFLLELQGCDIVETRFLGQTVYPKVVYNPNTYILRSTPCFSHDCYTLQVENQSPSLVQIQFLLDNYPQIKISRSKNYKNPGLEEDGIFLRPKVSKDLYLHFMPNDLATYEFILPIILNQIIGPPLFNDEKSQLPETYITLFKGNNKLQKYFNLECPSKIDSVHIDCSVARGYFEFSKRYFKFYVNERKEKKTKSITLKNITKEDIQIYFDTSVLANSPFTMEEGPTEDNAIYLKPYDTITVSLSFQPLFSLVFEIDLPLYVKEFSESSPYTTINVNGTLPKSVLYCATNLIQFLPVPLDCFVEHSLEIIATHQYKDTMLSSFVRRIIGEYQGEEVFDFHYSRGKSIPKNQEPFTIPVRIRFKSKNYFCSRGTIVFTDDQDGQCIVHFTACADNSIMSHYIYFFLHDKVEDKMSMISRSSVKSTSMESLSEFPLNEMHLDKISFSEVKPDIQEEILSFPKFPKRSSNSSYASYMRRTLHSMEQWLFEQGFCGSYRMVIGDHVAFSRAFVTATNSRSRNTNCNNVKSIIDLILSYVGRDFNLEYQIPSLIPEDDSGRIAYCFTVYRQVLQFLKVQGGSVTHIFPVYLLCYEDYVFYYNEVKLRSLEQNKKSTLHYRDVFDDICTSQVFLSEEEFERYNLQAWLDLIMQVHRTIIQLGLPYRQELRSCLEKSSLSDSVSVSTKSASGEKRVISYHSEMYENRLIESMPHLKKLNLERPEKVLLLWLNLVYREIKFGYFDQYQNHWPERLIVNLHEDLQDGVVLAAVTIFYCPYLEDLYFKDFYYKPTDRSQSHHNGVILATAWNAIRLGLTVTPSNFYNMNPVFMMILVCHIHSVMRTYIPHASVQFLSCLSESVTRKITVGNSNTASIGYVIKILGDTNESFSLEKKRPMIVLSPKSTNTITVSFMARTIIPVKAVLILCGTCLPNGYCNNMVFTLEGGPHKLAVTTDYVISTPIYKPTFINANMISPYSMEGEYEVWYTEEEPRPGKLNIQKWSSIRQQKLPRILYIGCNRLYVPPINSSHPAVLPLTAACYSLTNSYFWIILRNQNIGDFIVKVSIIPRIEQPFLVLPVPLPKGKCTGFPKTMCSFNCPRTFYIHVPCRNARLWSTVKTMFSLTLEKKEHPFWEHHLETRIGLDLVKWLLGDQNVGVAQEIGYLFNTKMKYHVKSLSEELEIEPSVVINDVHSPNFVNIISHICCMMEADSTVNIMLESDCGKEIRYYQVRFTGPSKNDEVSDAKRLSLPCRKCAPVVEPRPSRKSKLSFTHSLTKNK